MYLNRKNIPPPVVTPKPTLAQLEQPVEFDTREEAEKAFSTLLKDTVSFYRVPFFLLFLNWFLF